MHFGDGSYFERSSHKPFDAGIQKQCSQVRHEHMANEIVSWANRQFLPKISCRNLVFLYLFVPVVILVRECRWV